MPEGQYGLRVMSQHKVEVMMHVDGALAIRTEVASGLQYVDKDASGNFLFFARVLVRTSPSWRVRTMPKSTRATTTASAQAQPSLPLGDDDSVQLAMSPISDPGSVHLIVRFVDEPGPGLKPPAQEFEVIFQMNSPADHDNLVADKHLLTMVKPPQLINAEDETSFEPPQGHLPTFTCTCTGCVRNGH